MITYEFSGIITIFIISLGFLFIGYNVRLFTLSFFGILCSYIVFLVKICNETVMPGVIILTISGITLYFIGLLIVQTVIKRSVSLGLVMRPSKESTVRLMKTEMRSRIPEIKRCRLAIQQGNVIKLTLSGKLIGCVVGFVYVFFGMRR